VAGRRGQLGGRRERVVVLFGCDRVHDIDALLVSVPMAASDAAASALPGIRSGLRSLAQRAHCRQPDRHIAAALQLLPLEQPDYYQLHEEQQDPAGPHQLGVRVNSDLDLRRQPLHCGSPAPSLAGRPPALRQVQSRHPRVHCSLNCFNNVAGQQGVRRQLASPV